jgi:hypothetical protein
MIAFDVSVNGVHIGLVGVEPLGVLSAIVQAGRSRADGASDELRSYTNLTLGGLTGTRPREFVNWVSGRELSVGDEVLVRVVDVNSVDEPERRQPANSDDQEASRSDDAA